MTRLLGPTLSEANLWPQVVDRLATFDEESSGRLQGSIRQIGGSGGAVIGVPQPPS